MVLFNLVAIVGVGASMMGAVNMAYRLSENVAILSTQQVEKAQQIEHPSVYFGRLPPKLYNPLETGLYIREELGSVIDWYGLDQTSARICLLMNPTTANEYHALFPEYTIEVLADETAGSTTVTMVAQAVAIHVTGHVLLQDCEGVIRLPEFGVGDALRVKESCDVALAKTGINRSLYASSAHDADVRRAQINQLKGWRRALEVFDHPARNKAAREIAFTQSYLVTTALLPPVDKGSFWWPINQMEEIEHRMPGDHAEITSIMMRTLT